ncbi:MAG: hypothetical protein ACYTBJ_00620 [Planctomycetota bacterium]
MVDRNKYGDIKWDPVAQNFLGRFAIPHNDIPHEDLTPDMIAERDAYWEGPYGRAVLENAERKRKRRKREETNSGAVKRNRIRRKRAAFSAMLRRKYPNDPDKWLD